MKLLPTVKYIERPEYLGSFMRLEGDYLNEVFTPEELENLQHQINEKFRKRVDGRYIKSTKTIEVYYPHKLSAPHILIHEFLHHVFFNVPRLGFLNYWMDRIGQRNSTKNDHLRKIITDYVFDKQKRNKKQ